MHVAPDDRCKCGLHARTTLEGCTEEYPSYPVHRYWADRTTPSSGLAMGAVLMWGVTLRGSKVIRSQYAQVLCLTEKPELWASSGGANNPSAVPAENIASRQATLDAICTDYGVPIVPFESVTQYASEFGDLSGRPDVAA
jgi:hypothetical protein